MTDDTRHERFLGRAALRTVTADPRCFDCGRRSVRPGGGVEVRKRADGVVGFAGVFTCGKVWLCPVCNSKIAARRAIEIGVALAWAQREGLQVIWGSLTCRHTSASPLLQLLTIQKAAWRALVSSAPWRKANATQQVAHVEHSNACPWVCNFDHVCEGESSGCEFYCPRVYDTVQRKSAAGVLANGRVGYIRAAELTIGRNGYHPHFHPIILYRGAVVEAEAFAADCVEAWVAGVGSAGGDAIAEGGQRLRVVKGVEVFDALNGYVTKSTYNYAALGLEAVWSQSKNGRGRIKETASHWTLLVAIAQGLADEAGQWVELETALAGHRMITWSRGLRDFAGLNDEADDETVAAEDVGDSTDAVCVITAAGWVHLRDNPDALALVLNTLQAHGWAELRALLDFYGIEWATVEDLADTFDDANAGFARDQRDREYAAASSW